MSATTAHSLLKCAREARRSVLFYWEMARLRPDNATYYRVQRRKAFQQGLHLLQWAREELATEGNSPRSYLVEFDMEQRRAMTAYREAAE